MFGSEIDSEHYQLENTYTFHEIFPDIVVAYSVAFTFDRLPEDTVTIRELNEHTGDSRGVLEIRSSNVQSIEGLQHLTSFPVLVLPDNQISDIEPLRNLVGLQSLILTES